MTSFKRLPAAALILACMISLSAPHSGAAVSEPSKDNYIKWVDFNVPCEAMKKAISIDIASQAKDIKISWITLLAILACKNGNNFKNYRDSQLNEIAKKISAGTSIADLTKDYKYYNYYHEAFTAILGGFVGNFDVEVPDDDTGKRWESKYGIKVFSPIAKGFPYNHYDDFGTKRSYGYSRPHLGNDLMGQVGTPIVAVEGGIVEALGWNQYGGWRIGIRSLDSRRYYYYAHLRKGFPYVKTLKVGDTVMAGDVIGYLGRTGYSRKEDANNIKEPHLHFGMQLIFDESQKESVNEIWIDVYQIIRLLDNKRCSVQKNPDTKDYCRVYNYRDSSITAD